MAESLASLLRLGLGVAVAAILILGWADAAFTAAADDPPFGLAERQLIGLGRTGKALAAAGVALVIVGIMAVIWSPVLFASRPSPLQGFGPATGGGPIYVGTDSVGQVRYAMLSNGVVEYTFNLGNTGDSPVTITGLDGQSLPELEAGSAIFPANAAAPHSGDTVLTTAPFTIQDHSSLTVTLVARLSTCSALGSVPTLQPGMSPSASMADKLWADFRNELPIGSLRIRYAGPGGGTDVADIVLPAPLDLVGNDPTACMNNQLSTAP